CAADSRGVSPALPALDRLPRHQYRRTLYPERFTHRLLCPHRFAGGDGLGHQLSPGGSGSLGTSLLHGVAIDLRDQRLYSGGGDGRHLVRSDESLVLALDPDGGVRRAGRHPDTAAPRQAISPGGAWSGRVTYQTLTVGCEGGIVSVDI